MMRVTRYGGSWSPKGMIREMSVSEMVNWMNKNGYKLVWKRHLPDGRINMTYRKEGCKTEYGVQYIPEGWTNEKA